MSLVKKIPLPWLLQSGLTIIGNRVFLLYLQARGAFLSSLTTSVRLEGDSMLEGCGAAAGVGVVVPSSSSSSDSSSSSADSSVSSSCWYLGFAVAVLGSVCDSLKPFLAISACELRGGAMRSLDWRAVGETLVASLTGFALTTGLGSSLTGLVDVAFVVAALSLASAS